MTFWITWSLYWGTASWGRGLVWTTLWSCCRKSYPCLTMSSACPGRSGKVSTPATPLHYSTLASFLIFSTTREEGGTCYLMLCTAWAATSKYLIKCVNLTKSNSCHWRTISLVGLLLAYMTAEVQAADSAKWCHNGNWLCDVRYQTPRNCMLLVPQVCICQTSSCSYPETFLLLATVTYKGVTMAK